MLGKRDQARAAAVHVYFIQAETLGHIKIGKAVNIDNRLAALCQSSPDRLNLLGVIRPENAETLEAQLHRRFRSDRLHGEWFRATPDLLAYIEEAALPLLDDRRRWVDGIVGRIGEVKPQ